MKRERKFQFAREGKRKCNETLDEEVCRKVYIYIYIYVTWRGMLCSVETGRLFKFVHELSSHPLALNNCSLRLVFSYLGHTRTCTSIRMSKSVGDPLVTSRLVIAYFPYHVFPSAT